MTLAKAASTKKKGLFRIRGLVVVLATSVLLTLYVVFFFDLHLRQFCEATGTSVNSAAVNIASVKTSILSGTIELKGIQIADTSEPMQNLLEIDKIQMKVAWAPILRRKVLIEEMTIEGIRHATDRAVSGLSPNATNDTRSGLMERAAGAMYTEIRREIGDNPFRHIGQLLTGLNLTGRVEMNLKELASKKKAEALDQQLVAKLREFRNQTEQLKPIRSVASLSGKISEIEKGTPQKAEQLAKFVSLRQEMAEEQRLALELNEKLRKEMEGFAQEFQAVQTAITRDVSVLRNQLKLPKLDSSDLTPGMLGPVLIGQLERISYWVDLARRRMPTGYRGGQINVVAREGDRGVTVNFGKMSTYPAFLLRQVTITSKPDGRPGVGTVSGSIKGITSDPPIFGSPMSVALAADFPDRGVEKITLLADLDHTRDRSSEKIEFSAAKLPLKAFPVNDAGDLRLKITRGYAGFHGKIGFEGDQVTGATRITFHDVGFQVSSRFKRIEDTVKQAVSQVDTVDLGASVEGNLEGLKFQARSNLGSELARTIQTEFRHQILAVEDDLRKNILDQIYPILQRSEEHLRDLREAGPLPLEARLRALQDSMTHADKEIARLDGGASNTSRKNRSRQPARDKN